MVTRRFDDDEAFDAELHDPKFYPKLVYRDGKGPRVRLMLTDAVPPSRPALNRPRFAALDAAELQDGLRAAAAARATYISELQDAWRGPSNRPPALKDGQSPRDQYIARLTNAWKMPPGSASDADDDDDDPNAIEAQRRRWLSPGATPGSDATTVTKGAAVADREQAYAGYLDRLTNGWRK
jgi:hypothetical protein